MGKMKTLIEGLKGGVRRKLEALPPKARLGIVLTAFALFAVLCLYMTVTAIAGFGKGNGAFAVLCLYMTVTAIAGFGKGNGAMEIRHIEKLDLPVQENMNLYNNVYGKGTEEE